METKCRLNPAGDVGDGALKKDAVRVQLTLIDAVLQCEPRAERIGGPSSHVDRGRDLKAIEEAMCIRCAPAQGILEGRPVLDGGLFVRSYEGDAGCDTSNEHGVREGGLKLDPL
ncbi:MAG: hypothetical protein AAGD10_21275 [Myxococcota bacterium]